MLLCRSKRLAQASPQFIARSTSSRMPIQAHLFRACNEDRQIGSKHFLASHLQVGSEGLLHGDYYASTSPRRFRFSGCYRASRFIFAHEYPGTVKIRPPSRKASSRHTPGMMGTFYFNGKERCQVASDVFRHGR